MEMKKTWTKPLAVAEQFVANEYVAACGAQNTVYNFECNAGGGVWGSVYHESNGQPGLQVGPFGDECLAEYRGGLCCGPRSGYHACGKTHEAATTDEFLNGYYLPKGQPGCATDVIIWTEGGTDVHCTTKLDMDQWETSKS